MNALANRGGNVFQKHERIHRRAEYKSIYEQGARTFSRNFILVSRNNRLGYRRLGITVSKKVGNSVRRNRIKRMIREFFRLHKNRLAASQDIVIIGRKGIPSLSYQDVCRELAGLLSPEATEQKYDYENIG